MVKTLHSLILSTALVALCRPGAAAAERELREFLGWPLHAALTAYQKTVSPAKGTRCLMMPSDSAFARQAIRRRGPWTGLWLAIDRLHRCGHDQLAYSVVMTSEGPRLWDPLDPSERPAP